MTYDSGSLHHVEVAHLVGAGGADLDLPVIAVLHVAAGRQDVALEKVYL